MHLRRHGYDVTWVGDGLEAWESFEAARSGAGEGYSIVVSDAMLPGIDGVTPCRRVRETRPTAIVLRFENTSSRTCTLDGHPGVSFVGQGNGTQLGRPATFVGAVDKVRLSPGGQVGAQLRVASPGPYGDDCAPVQPDGFRVYPPDSRASIFVPETSLQACSKRLPGGRSQLSVTAVGSTD